MGCLQEANGAVKQLVFPPHSVICSQPDIDLESCMQGISRTSRLILMQA